MICMTDINLYLLSELLGDKKLFVPVCWKACRSIPTEKPSSIHFLYVTHCWVLGINHRA